MSKRKMSEILEADGAEEFNADSTPSSLPNLYITEPLTCPHIQCFKGENGDSRYRKVLSIFIMPISGNHRAIKAELFRCIYKSCYGRLLPRLHTCLTCQAVCCFDHKHMHHHAATHNHYLAMDISYGNIYCFVCDTYIIDEHFDNIYEEQAAKAFKKGLTFPYKARQREENNWLVSEFGSVPVSINEPHIGLRGLINLGSTCFMNCIVQTLVHTPMLVRYFTHNQPRTLHKMSHICKFAGQPLKCLVCQMDNLFQEYYSKKSHTPHIPYQLLYLVWTHAKQLAGYEQQDAHEFFISTLGIWHRHSGVMDFTTKQCTCIVDKIFSGSLQSDVVCQSCGGVSSVEDPIWDFSLDLVNTHLENGKTAPLPSTLKDCLYLFTRTEHLGSTAKIKCGKCQSYQESTKQLSIKKLPIVASFHLKRFEQTNSFNKKISTYIEFPTKLDMTPFTSLEIGYQARNSNMTKTNHDKHNSKDNDYNLFAVVNHNGTLDNGHYTVFIKLNESQKWYKCDDHFVLEATEDEVLRSEGYLLFYQKQKIEYEF